MASSSPIWSVVDSTHTWPRESTVDDVDYILHGRFDHLPPAPSKVVRIFLSSTFTDTYVERNLLIKRVYPKLQRICKEKYNLDFQVMLYWIHHKFYQTYFCCFISSFTVSTREVLWFSNLFVHHNLSCVGSLRRYSNSQVLLFVQLFIQLFVCCFFRIEKKSFTGNSFLTEIWGIQTQLTLYFSRKRH